MSSTAPGAWVEATQVSQDAGPAMTSFPFCGNEFRFGAA